MARLLINGVEYPLDDGYILNEKKTEELNSAIITMGFVDKLDLSPFDFVEIVDGDKTKYFVIDTWNNTTASFNPMKYIYTVSLISEAVKLQKIVLPNIGITQPIGTTQKTIKDKILEYYELFIKPQYPEITISDELLALTESVIVAETLFGRPTMMEVLNNMLLKIGCCIDLVNHQLTYKRLDDYGEEIDMTKIHYENDTQNISEYADRLDVEVENTISSEVNYSSVAGITVRGDNDAFLTDDNMVILLDKPIYDMKDKSVYIFFPVYDTKATGEQTDRIYKKKYDITDYIVEKSVYDTYLTSMLGTTGKGYKRNTLYYVAGDNKIQGLSYTEDTEGGIDRTALYNIITMLLAGTGLLPEFLEMGMKNNVFFEVEYKTSDSFRLIVEKENDYNATLIDSQNEKQVDAFSFGKVEQDKINRLGNKEIIITATYKRDEKIPELGDYIGRYVLAQREIVQYDDFALFKGYLYKDFVRKNMFYCLNSRKRFTQISDEYVVRNEVINYDLSFTSTEPTDDYEYLKRFMLQPLANYSYTGEIYPERAKYMLFKFKDKNGADIIDDGYVALTSSYYVCGKSNVLTASMRDNYSAGIQIEDRSVMKGNPQKEVKYVDNYGEFKSLELTLRSTRGDEFLNHGTGSYLDFDTFRPIADALPYISDYNVGSLNTNYLLKENKLVYKDNREVFTLSVNFNFKDTNEVIIGDFARFTGIMKDKVENLRFCYSTKDYYEVGDTVGLGEETEMTIDTYLAEGWYEDNDLFSNISFRVNSISGTSGWTSYGVLDENGVLILGVNSIKGKNPATNLYLHVNKKEY